MTPFALTDLALAVVLGTSFGLGVALLASLAPRWGAPSLARRIGPYVRDVADARGIAVWGAAAPAPILDLRAASHAVRDRLDRMLGGSDAIQRRLRQAGWVMDASTFRSRQLAWSLAGVAAAGALVVGLVVAGRGSGGLALLPPVLGAVAAFGYDAHLTHAARARMARIEEELPTVVEFLALCLSAGEGTLDSLRRVSGVGAGELTAELRVVVVAVGTGSGLSDALGDLSRRLEIPALSRVVDQLVAALERGAPLAQVLHAQALDAREDAKRTLIEQAGRKEILMLVPLVFLILPLSVLFAVFPGIFMLRLGIG